MEHKEPLAVTKKLWRVTVIRHREEMEEVARLALDAEQIDPATGWRFDCTNGLLVLPDDA
jgi:hypothetical protein